MAIKKGVRARVCVRVQARPYHARELHSPAKIAREIRHHQHACSSRTVSGTEGPLAAHTGCGSHRRVGPTGFKVMRYSLFGSHAWLVALPPPARRELLLREQPWQPEWRDEGAMAERRRCNGRATLAQHTESMPATAHMQRAVGNVRRDNIHCAECKCRAHAKERATCTCF